jgi:hypothetical protein
VRQALERLYHWLTEPGSPVPAGLFRILVAAFCVANIVVIRGHLVEIYGRYGFVQWAITRANLHQSLPHLGDLANALARFGLSADDTLYLVVGTYVVVLLVMLIGLASRFMAVAAWCLHFLLIYAGDGLLYGMDMFAHIALLFCIVMPIGEYLSVDALLLRRPLRYSQWAGVSRKLLQLQVCAIYLSAGVEKALGVQWWNGDAIWRTVLLPSFHTFDMTWLAQFPALAVMGGWSIVTIECGYSVFIWWPRTRRLWLALVIGMHFFIGLLLGMWLFGAVMIVLNLGAFGYDALPAHVRRALERLQLGRAARDPVRA